MCMMYLEQLAIDCDVCIHLYKTFDTREERCSQFSSLVLTSLNKRDLIRTREKTGERTWSYQSAGGCSVRLAAVCIPDAVSTYW